MSKEMKELHQAMVQAIHGSMHPDLEDGWEQYKGMLRPYLSDLEIKQMKTFDISVEKLKEHDEIDYGDYQLLIKIFTTIQRHDIRKIIEYFTNQMKEQRAIEIENENIAMETADGQLNIQ